MLTRSDITILMQQVDVTKAYDLLSSKRMPLKRSASRIWKTILRE